MAKLPVLKQPTLATLAMRLIGSVYRSRQTQLNPPPLVSIHLPSNQNELEIKKVLPRSSQNPGC